MDLGIDDAAIRSHLDEKSRSRERGLQGSREIIRSSANAIRAVHRGELDAARTLIDSARMALVSSTEAMAPHPDILFAGFLQDAQKEFAEASITFAIVGNEPIPTPGDLGVGVAPYLNGLGETVGELRREVLDILRRGETGRCEELLHVVAAFVS